MDFDIAAAIKDFGFPIIAAVGLGYFVFYIWNWVTQEIDPVVDEARTTLIGLVDRIRMLDNDMIRLNTKLAMILEYQKKKGMMDEETAEEILSEFTSKGKQWQQPKVNSRKNENNSNSDSTSTSE